MNSIIYQVLANDNDALDHIHGRLNYVITAGNTGNVFNIDTSTGEVKVIYQLPHML